MKNIKIIVIVLLMGLGFGLLRYYVVIPHQCEQRGYVKEKS